MNYQEGIALDLISYNASVAKEPWPLGVFVYRIAEYFGLDVATVKGRQDFSDFVFSFGDASEVAGLLGDSIMESILVDIVAHRDCLFCSDY